MNFYDLSRIGHSRYWRKTDDIKVSETDVVSCYIICRLDSLKYLWNVYCEYFEGNNWFWYLPGIFRWDSFIRITHDPSISILLLVCSISILLWFIFHSYSAHVSMFWEKQMEKRYTYWSGWFQDTESYRDYCVFQSRITCLFLR